MFDVLRNHIQKENCHILQTHYTLLVWHSNTLNINSCSWPSIPSCFSTTASYSSPHSVIWLYGLVAVNRWGGIDGANLSCGVESTIFHTGCNNNLQSHLIELSHHIAPANISSSGFQMESRPKYYGREWVQLNCCHFLCLFFFSNIVGQWRVFIYHYCLTSEVVMV